MIKNIIFDWSGVISDDFAIVYRTTMEVFKQFNVEPVEFELFKKRFRFPLADFYNEYLPGINLSEIDEFYFNKIDLVGLPEIYAGALDILNELKARGLNLIVFSSHNREKIINEMDRYKIDKNIFLEINGDLKNKVEEIDSIFDRHKWVKNETIYVGDTVHDILAAKRSNVRIIASTYGYCTEIMLLEYCPMAVISDISELPEVINRIS